MKKSIAFAFAVFFVMLNGCASSQSKKGQVDPYTIQHEDPCWWLKVDPLRPPADNKCPPPEITWTLHLEPVGDYCQILKIPANRCPPRELVEGRNELREGLVLFCGSETGECSIWSWQNESIKDTVLSSMGVDMGCSFHSKCSGVLDGKTCQGRYLCNPKSIIHVY